MMAHAVKTTDEKFERYKNKWTVCRDVVGGKEDVFGKGEEYLPRLSDQTTEEYKAYQKRAGWYGATDRTKQALKGMIFRKDPDIRLHEELEEFEKDATLSGVSLKGVSSMLTDEILKTGRAGLLVDHQRRPEGSEDMTQKEAERLNLRAYVQVYKAEQILPPRVERVNNKTMVTQIRLLETFEVDGVSEFEKDTLEQVRVLELVDGVYQQRLFRQETKGGEFVQHEPVTPKKDGKPFDYIPFWFIGVQDMDPDYDKPPLEDLAELNLDYYRTKADYKHGLHFTGLPTAVITGHRPEDENKEFRIGSTTAWVFKEEGARAFYLEFSGGGLSELSKEAENLKGDMAAMGVRMLAPEKKQAEASETHMIKRSGEHSLLGSIANNISSGLTAASKVVGEWVALSEAQIEEIGVHLNTDFLPEGATPDDLLKMIQAVQSGEYHREDYLYWLKKKELIDPTIDDTDRRADLETSPTLGMGGGFGPGE